MASEKKEEDLRIKYSLILNYRKKENIEKSTKRETNRKKG